MVYGKTRPHRALGRISDMMLWRSLDQRLLAIFLQRLAPRTISAVASAPEEQTEQAGTVPVDPAIGPAANR